MGVIELLAFVVIGYIVAGAFLLWWLERSERVGSNYSQNTGRS